VVVGHSAPIVGFQSLAVVQTAVAALLSAVFWCAQVLWLAQPVHFRVTPELAGAVLLTGLFATALAFTAQAWAQQFTSATRAALIFALEPVVAWFTAWMVDGETLAIRGKVGAGLILGGILLVELKRSKPEAHQIIEAESRDTLSRSSRRLEEE
jgi:drug/metabolite transporter (DMT)-like permease